MSTKIKVTTIGISGVLLLGGLFATIAPVGPKVSERPATVSTFRLQEYYGVMIPDTIKAREKALQVHLHCESRDSWYQPETLKECKLRLGMIVAN